MNLGFDYREQVAPADAGKTVLEYLSCRRRHSTEAVWRERIAAGEVQLQGGPASVDDVLRAGQILVWRRPPWIEPDVPLAFAVLYRDEHLLAVAKPRGLPSVPNGGFLTHTLLHVVRRIFPEVVPIHRLGRGTSGLVAFARTVEARRGLSAALREGRIEKTYRALVTGVPERAAFTVDVPIGPVPHPRLGQVHAASARGRHAVTHVQVLGVDQGDALVEAIIPTGRPHQIRIHLAAAGHPLVGDALYAAGGGLTAAPALPGDSGYWLHAMRLAFRHPATGAALELECAPPPPLRLRRRSGSATRTRGGEG
jgi:23S rRNA pseudouridine1911/1915/1917 synthase